MPESIDPGEPRHRDRSSNEAGTGSYTMFRQFVDGSVDISAHTYPYDFTYMYEWMDDRHGAVRIGDDGRMRNFVDTNVTHNTYRSRGGRVRAAPVEAVDAALIKYVYSPNDDAFLSLPLGSAVDHLVPLPPGDLHEDLMRHALRGMTRQIPIKVGANELLQDLTSLKSLIPSLEESLTRTIASGWLNLSFGWAPFLDDLKTAMGLLKSVQDRLQFLRDTWGREVKLSSVRKGFWEPPAIPYQDSFGDPPFVTRVRRESYRATFRAGCYYTHHLEGLNDKLTELRAIGFALGLNNPLLALWESLPFSFILDWLLGVDAALDEAGFNALLQGDTWIRRPTYSVTVEATLRWGQYLNWIPVVGYYNVGNEYLATVRSYRRWSGIPEAPGLFDLGSLSPIEASFLLAIAAGSSY